MGLPDYEAALQRERELCDRLAGALETLLSDMNKEYLPCDHPKAGFSTAHELAVDGSEQALTAYDEARKS